MKVCVLGNSHSACLKYAWEEARATSPDIDVTFFATFGVSLKNLQVEENRLVPTTKTLRATLLYTSGHEDVDIGAYDAFLLCGLGMRLAPIDRRLSSQVLDQWSRDVVEESLAYSLATNIRRLTDAPIYVMPPPLEDKRVAREPIVDSLSYAYCFSLLEKAFEVSESLPSDSAEQTIHEGHFTKYEFSKDAARLALSMATENMQHDLEDTSHMNAAFGAVRLQQLISLLRHSAD